MRRYGGIMLALMGIACGPAAVDPAVIDELRGVKIRREVFSVATPEAPASPSGAATEGSLNQVTVVRYRVDARDPKPARAIVVLMPGFLGGAQSFDALARALVRRSTADAPLEAWAIDRRANGLEDLRGHDHGVATSSADALNAYYFEGAAIDGQQFAGFKSQADVPFMSEWGLAVTVNDLHAVLALIPAEQRKARVVLVGHSMGGQMAAQYAAWDFDGTAGFDQLAGLVMVDAVTGGEGHPAPMSQADYETTGVTDPDGFGTVSLQSIRDTTRYIAIPLIESKLFVVGAATALRAKVAPDKLEKDTQRYEALKTLFLMDPLPRLTNRAAFGLAFDLHSSPLSISGVTAGEATGGALTESPSVLGEGVVVKPTDTSALYTWQEYDQVTPVEHTSLGDLALAWLRPQVDFGEWYFPARLNLDCAAAASLALGPTDWQLTAYGLRTTHGAQMDLPILAEAAGILKADVSQYDALKALVAATPVGPGRPLAGATRTGSDGFQTLAHPTFSHLDTICGVDDPGSQTAEWYDALAGFALRNTPAGGVAVAVQR